MSTFKPGEGWIAVDVSDPNSVVYQLALYGDEGELVAAWVCEEPVPPLPTEPYTVIRVTWQQGRGARNNLFMLTTDRHFSDAHWRGEAGLLRQRELVERITGFEVLAEPVRWGEQRMKDEAERVRRETAKAVLEAISVATVKHGHLDPAFTEVAREFGVES